MSSRNHLELHSPATGFIDAFPVGNGSLGAVVHCLPGVERLDLNIDTLWSGGPLVPETGPARNALIEPLRAAISEGDFLRADELARSLQGPGYTQSYQPLGWVEWCYSSNEAIGDYKRVLDVESAETVVTYSTAQGAVSAATFSSAPANVIVSSAVGPGVANGDLNFASAHPDVIVEVAIVEGVTWVTATGRAPEQVFPNYVDDADPAVVYATSMPDEHGLVDAGMGFAVVAAVHRVGPDEVRLIASAQSGFRGYDQRPSADVTAIAQRARRDVEKALTASTKELRSAHRADYSSYFGRVGLDLSESKSTVGSHDPARAELYFSFGRYLLISSSRPGSQAANLQGIWNVDVRPGWSSNYTTNINIQMNYWPAEAAALGDLLQPMFALVSELAAAGESTAQRYYGARGAAVHHNTDIWRFSSPAIGDPQWANWPSGLMWLASHLWEHIQFGADNKFAVGVALPVYQAASEFALDMLVEGPDGTLVFSPSTSPEHLFLVEGGHAATSAGTTMDQELVKETLSRFLSLAELDDQGSAHRALSARARLALGSLCEPRVGEQGNLLEWSDDRPPREPGHRHVSHLYGLYPGSSITETGTPDRFEAARVALQMRLDAGTGYTGWSQAWVLNLAARLRDSDLAEKSIGILTRDLSSDSLLDLHPHDNWPGGFIFQIDGNFGAVAGMIELLLQSHEGTIALLKTLPGNWDRGHVHGLRARGGHTVDIDWHDGRLIHAQIVAGGDGPIVLDVPAGSVHVSTSEGTVEIEAMGDAGLNRDRYKWAARAGSTYVIKTG